MSFLLNMILQAMCFGQKSAGGAVNDYGAGIATDATGNIYLTGNFNSASFMIGSFILTRVGNQDIFSYKI